MNDLDLSAHAHRATHYVLSSEAIKTIENIKLKYAYQGDLHQLLLDLPSWVVSFKDVKRQNGRAKIKKALLIKTLKDAEN